MFVVSFDFKNHKSAACHYFIQMIAIKKEGIILSETELEFENDGVLNPAIIQEGNTVHMLYRAVRIGNPDDHLISHRKCGTATCSQDLIEAIEDKYGDSFTIKVCTLQKANIQFNYPEEVKCFLKYWLKVDCTRLALEINKDIKISFR